jgi:hypothetical protein
MRRQLVTPLVDQVADLEEDVRALAERRRAPSRKGGSGGGHGRRDLVDGREIDVLRQRPRGGVVDIALTARRPGDDAAADPVTDPAGRGSSGGLVFGDLRHRVVLVGILIGATIPRPP